MYVGVWVLGPRERELQAGVNCPPVLGTEPGPLAEQPVLLATKASPQLSVNLLLRMLFTII